MPKELNIEKLIQEAMDRGEFDNLKGKGKPLDLDAYFSTPEDIRMAFSILRSNEFVPEEVDMLREIRDLKNRLKTCENEAEMANLTRELQQKQLGLTIALEKYRRKR